jgi:hypothetical protein
MADTPRKAVKVDENAATGTVVWEWSGLDGDDTGIPVFMGKYPDMTVQIAITTHGDATHTWEGTLDPRGNPAHADHANAVWSPMTDTTETVISATTTSLPLTQVLQKASWVRPKQTGGTSTVSKVWLHGTVRG